MPQRDEDLVISRAEREREVSGAGSVSDRRAVHEDGARADRAELQPRPRGRPLEMETRRERHLRRHAEAGVGIGADPPRSREVVGQAAANGSGDARENQQGDGERETAASRRPPGEH